MLLVFRLLGQNRGVARNFSWGRGAKIGPKRGVVASVASPLNAIFPHGGEHTTPPLATPLGQKTVKVFNYYVGFHIFCYLWLHCLCTVLTVLTRVRVQWECHYIYLKDINFSIVKSGTPIGNRRV
jgi:hypothetical protein